MARWPTRVGQRCPTLTDRVRWVHTSTLHTDKGWPLLRKVSGLIPRAPPHTQLHVTTSLSTGGGPVSSVQLSEGGFQVVYPLGLWSRFSGVVKVLYGYG